MSQKAILGLALLFSIHCFGQDRQETIDGVKKKNLLQSIYKVIADNYVFPDKGTAMINNLKKQMAGGTYDVIINPNEFAAAVTRDIKSIYSDKHIRITYDPKLQKDIVAFTSSKKGAAQVNYNDSLHDVKQNFYFRKVEIFPSNIGYIEFTSFAKPNASVSKTINAVMQFVSHTDALIIDLRNNFGGNGLMANEILSYFFRSRTFTGRSFNKIENKWNDEFIENKSSVTGGLVLNVPIYILTSARTYSSAEGFAYTLQNLKNAIIIGDTTRGGAHLTRSFSLGDGFVAFIPYLRTENAKTKTNWEGIGVIPQVTIDESQALMTAKKMALTDKLAMTNDETEKKKITWLINYYQSQDAPASISVTDYSQAIGRFAEFEIAIFDNQLMFRDTNHRTKDFKTLVPITPVLFQVERDYQVELIKDTNGQYNSIKIFWDDGWSEVIPRNQ